MHVLTKQLACLRFKVRIPCVNFHIQQVKPKHWLHLLCTQTHKGYLDQTKVAQQLYLFFSPDISPLMITVMTSMTYPKHNLAPSRAACFAETEENEKPKLHNVLLTLAITVVAVVSVDALSLYPCVSVSQLLWCLFCYFVCCLFQLDS